MAHHLPDRESFERSSRRQFLEWVGEKAAAGSVAAALWQQTGAAQGAEPPAGTVKKRDLGRTGLRVSEIGFGGHSWAYARVPDGRGGLRKPSLDEAARMIARGLDLGVNFFDSCTPEEEHSVPGEVIKRLGKRGQVILSARPWVEETSRSFHAVAVDAGNEASLPVTLHVRKTPAVAKAFGK